MLSECGPPKRRGTPDWEEESLNYVHLTNVDTCAQISRNSALGFLCMNDMSRFLPYDRINGSSIYEHYLIYAGSLNRATKLSLNISIKK